MRNVLLIALISLSANAFAENGPIQAQQVIQPNIQITADASSKQDTGFQNMFISEVVKQAGHLDNKINLVSESKHIANETISFQNSFINEVVKQSTSLNYKNAKVDKALNSSA